MQLMGGRNQWRAQGASLARLEIREIVENWAVLRDARRWDRFRQLWHEEGRMITTWIEGAASEEPRPAKLATIRACASCTSSAALPSISSAIVQSPKQNR